jgi:hypothetical protein
MADRDDGEGLGARFWLGLVGICAAAAVGAGIVFAIFGRMWEAYGFFGAFVVFGAVLVGIGWLYDRRQKHRRDDLAAELRQP